MPKRTTNVASGPARKFRGTLVRQPGKLGWTTVEIPFDAAKLWGRRGTIRIKGTINGFEFGCSIFPTGDGRHILPVNRAMQKGGRMTAGMTAEFHIQPDTAKRKIVIPPELAKELKQSRALQKYFDAQSDSMRFELGRMVAQPKSAEARTRRAQDIAERLMTCLLGERGELPPILESALRQTPVARTGWDKMPRSRRMWHLYGVSAYKSPEARARRLNVVIQDAIGYGTPGMKKMNLRPKASERTDRADYSE